MSAFLLAVAVFLLGTLAGGLVRVVRGPTHADRLIAVQLFGTAGVAFLLLLAEARGAPELRDVALVFALLASVVVVAFVKRGWVRQERDPERHERGAAPESSAGTGSGDAGRGRAGREEPR